MPTFCADRWRSASDLWQLPHLEVMTFNPFIQIGMAADGINFIGFSAPLSGSTEHLGRDRIRYFGHAKPVVAVDDDRFSPGNYFAFQKELDRFLYLAIEFDD